MLCSKNHQVITSLILLLRWMENLLVWITQDIQRRIQFAVFKWRKWSKKHKLTHWQIRVNFRWLNISGSKHLKQNARKPLMLTRSYFSSWSSEKPGMSQCWKFKINLTKTLELLIKQLFWRPTFSILEIITMKTKGTQGHFTIDRRTNCFENYVKTPEMILWRRKEVANDMKTIIAEDRYRWTSYAW